MTPDEVIIRDCVFYNNVVSIDLSQRSWQPLSSTGKRLRGVNARRRRQARHRGEMRAAIDLINRSRPEALRINFSHRQRLGKSA